MRVQNSRNVTIQRCAFANLGGAGVVFELSSSHSAVLDSSFADLGQSAIVAIGNSTTQPHHLSFVNNRMSKLGRVLISAGGVYCSACPDTLIAANDIVNVPRW